MFYSATGQVGWYAVAVQIEDFAKPNDTEPLSSIPLQFLVRVFESDNNCTNKPEFIEPTRIATSCVGVPFNATFFEPLIAKTGSDTIRLVTLCSYMISLDRFLKIDLILRIAETGSD